MEADSTTTDPYSITYSKCPAKWDEDPSFLLKAAYKNGEQVVAASGWNLRQIEFETHEVVKFKQPLSDGTGTINLGNTDHGSEILWDEIDSYELEVVQAQDHRDKICALIAQLATHDVADAMMNSIEEEMITRVSANRANKTLHIGSECIDTVDLLCQNLPARSGNLDEPLRSLSRWCRIFKLKQGTITIYKELDPEQKQQLRWPHNCIWLNRGAEYYTKPSKNIGKIEDAIKIPIEYELYNLDNWRVEFEFWENRPFQIAVIDDSEVAADRLSVALIEVGILSDFITITFLSVRNLKRRIDQNRIIASSDEIKNYAIEKHEKMSEMFVNIGSYLKRHRPYWLILHNLFKLWQTEKMLKLQSKQTHFLR